MYTAAAGAHILISVIWEGNVNFALLSLGGGNNIWSKGLKKKKKPAYVYAVVMWCEWGWGGELIPG